MKTRNRIISAAAAASLSSRLRKSGGKVIFTNGCFDILHAGHVRLFEKARNLGTALIVGLNSDASIRRLKGPSRPVNEFRDRAEVLASLRAVDYVVGFSQDTPYSLIRKIRPDILVKGGDYSPQNVVGREFAGKVFIFPLVKGKSTTKIIEKASHK